MTSGIGPAGGERLCRAIRAAVGEGRTALAPFLTAGFPERDGFAEPRLAVSHRVAVLVGEPELVEGLAEVAVHLELVGQGSVQSSVSRADRQRLLQAADGQSVPAQAGEGLGLQGQQSSVAGRRREQ